MSFKIINPGYGGLFHDHCFETYENFTYNPTHGVSFYVPSNSSSGNSDDALYWRDSYSSTDFYMKFDAYFPENVNTSERILVRVVGKIIMGISQSGTETSIGAAAGDFNGADTNIILGAVNTFWIHVKAGEESDWEITLKVNGKTIFEYDGESYSGILESGESVGFQLTAKIPVSNLIISDEFIDPKEIIVRVDNSAIETTMLESDTTYRTASAGDYVLEVLDTSQLYSTFGANGKVSGMVAIAAPAYTTGEDITKLKCRTVDGETVTDYDEQNLGTDASGVVAEYLTFDSDTTFASLNGFKVGWVTGA